jgi:hypothetical protein
MCAACQFAKPKQRTAPGTQRSIVRDRVDALQQDQVFPGQRVSVDNFICSTKGRLFSGRGKTEPKDMYSGGCIFIDSSSGCVQVEFQAHLNTHKTLAAKERFELSSRDVGVVPQEYLLNNGSAFTSKAFADHLAKFEQTAKFAGVGAHHHNGIAKRTIQTIMSIARAMLINAAVHWPAIADAQLWPMAVQQAVYLWNRMPSQVNGLSPVDIFTCSRWEQTKFRDIHVWGCPVYVLDQ